MPHFIKKSNKPIEAKQLTDNNRDELLEWCLGKKAHQGCILLKTPESGDGFQWVVTGDWIVKGYSEQQGWHFWPVKPDYFAENYMEVSLTDKQ